jgi:hypothetical protein
MDQEDIISMRENCMPEWKKRQLSHHDDNYAYLLRNLLAVIHRDGGQYTAMYGIEKSVEDAMQIVSNLIVK